MRDDERDRRLPLARLDSDRRETSGEREDARRSRVVLRIVPAGPVAPRRAGVDAALHLPTIHEIALVPGPELMQ